MRSTKAIIDLSAIQHNLKMVKQFAPKTQVMAVVKADAYGHGIVKVSQQIPESDAIAVACMDEAITLRNAGIQNEIILLEGFFSQNELRQVLEYNLQTVIHQESQLNDLIQISELKTKPKKLTLWLKVDSGMNRLGFELKEFSRVYHQLKNLPWVDSINLMSHLACADDINNPLTQSQVKRFNEITQLLDEPKSMANSAGVVAWPETHFNWVRPGIILYGCSPMIGLTGEHHQLKPAMTLQSKLFSIKQLNVGDTVGYGASWQAKQPTRIGVIAIGYGDGYPRHAKEGTPVLINGKLYPLVGKVSMDMITVDLGMQDEVALGTEAILWGKGLPVETVAQHADTIAYTLLCGVTSRVRFEWLDV